MVYCKTCGKEIPDNAEFCPACGARQYVSELVLATWGERFLAFIIDAILVGMVAGLLRPMYWAPAHMPFIDFGVSNVLLFLYWAFLEGTQGQSLGKKVMHIKVVDLRGGAIDMGKSLYQAIGKAFLLPLDLILGWLMYSERQQRLFNYLSGTLVVKE